MRPPPLIGLILVVVLHLGAVRTHGNEPAVRLVLSEAEAQWVETNGSLRVGYTPDWPPFSFRGGDGQPEGIDIEIMRRFGEATGLDIEFVTADNWEAIYEMGVAGSVDLITGMSATPERRQYFSFSHSYLSFPVAIIIPEGDPFVLTLNGMEGRTFALPGKYVTTEQFLRDCPQHEVVLTSSSTESLLLVSRGEADATLENMVAASHIIRSEGLSNLKIGGVSDYRFDLRFGVVNGRDELLTLLNRFLHEMEPKFTQQILSDWVPVQAEEWVVWENVWPVLKQIILIGLAILIVILIWNVRLTREVRARVEAQRKLEQMIEKRGQMLAWIAHDLKSPLSAIQLYLDQARLGLRGEGKEAEEDIELVKGSVNQIDHLASRLQQLQDAESGLKNFKPEPVSLAELFRRVTETHQLTASQKQIRIVSELPGTDEVHFRSDRETVTQILDNLLTNALKFSPRETTVRLKGSRSGETIRIQVEDEGVGIPEDEVSHVFEPYSRISSQPTAGESSTGLGLIIVRALVHALGGTVTVESRVGKGSVFTVEIPDRISETV